VVSPQTKVQIKIWQFFFFGNLKEKFPQNEEYATQKKKKKKKKRVLAFVQIFAQKKREGGRVVPYIHKCIS
jgi:hypothetical protein